MPEKKETFQHAVETDPEMTSEQKAFWLSQESPDELWRMPAGRKMNQTIWWKVFEMEPTPPNNDMALLPDYSHEIAPAFAIVKKLESNPREILFKITRKGTGDINSLYWAAEFRECRGTHKTHYAEAETAPLAICRAALLAVMGGV